MPLSKNLRRQINGEPFFLIANYSTVKNKKNRMEIDLNNTQIEELRTQTNSLLKVISDLVSYKKELLSDYDTLKIEDKDLSSKMGWKEQFLNGIISGDKALIKKHKETERYLKETTSELEYVESELKKESQLFRNEIAKYLTENHNAFKILTNERERHLNLYNASSEYDNLLKRARQGVMDALLWTGWEKLIRHPDAQNQLNKFIIETRKYQDVINSYEDHFNIKINGDSLIEDYIKFSFEREAIESFNSIIYHVQINMNYALNIYENTHKSRKKFIDYVETELLKG